MTKWLYGFSDVVLDEDIELISKYIVIKDKNGKVVGETEIYPVEKIEEEIKDWLSFYPMLLG